MQSIALVTYQDPPFISESDVLLISAFKEKGITASFVAWDNKEANWSDFDCAIFRSCWDYQTRIEEFREWLTLLETQNIKTWNPLSIIRWNIHKTYLLELEKKGVLIVPTTAISKNTFFDLKPFFDEKKYSEIIVKPAISASAMGVIKITVAEVEQKQADVDKLLSVSDILVQPLMPQISNGEMSLVFIGKKYSHTVLKKPKAGDFISNIEYGGTETIIQPNLEIISQAENIVNVIPGPLLYTRVDGIIVDGKFMLMELELIEPHMFFDLAPDAASRFVEELIINSS